ncbi:MAG: PAS domain-containing protein [Anaerolineales bacterium]|nr:PAS domain-containing protein [Anaerolineales bacterium]
MDATTRKTGEQALYASEETYRGLVESLDSVVAVVHASGRFLYVNELGAHQLGKDQNTLIGKTMADLFPEPFASNQMKNVRSVIAADEALVVENQSFVRGEPRWYRTSIQPLHDDAGTVTRALLTSTDITQQKITQRELEELNRTLEQRVLERTAQLQDLYDNAPVGYHSLDAQGKFVMINQTELNWLGCSRGSDRAHDDSPISCPIQSGTLRPHICNLQIAGMGQGCGT